MSSGLSVLAVNLKAPFFDVRATLGADYENSALQKPLVPFSIRFDDRRLNLY